MKRSTDATERLDAESLTSSEGFVLKIRSGTSRTRFEHALKERR